MMFNLDDKDEFGFKCSDLKSKAAAMYKLGATRLQVEEALGNPYLTVLAEVESMGYTILRKKVRVGKNRPHFRYTIIGDGNVKNGPANI